MYKTLDLKFCYYHYVPKRVQAHIVKAMQNKCKIMSLENVQAEKTMKVSPLPLTILGNVHLEVRVGWRRGPECTWKGPQQQNLALPSHTSSA